MVNDDLVALKMTSAADPWLQLAVAASMTIVLAAVLWRGGLLAYAAALFVWSSLFASLVTFDLSRWYAWQGWVSVALIAALAIWGFRNVLERQTTLPGGVLDG